MTAHDFDPTLLTGYLDGELTQADQQRVRLHLEDCAACRAELDEMRELAEATRGSAFTVPVDLQWDETPRTNWSRGLNVAGLVLAMLAVVAVVVALVWELAADDTPVPFGVIIPVVVVAAFLAVTASALIDRLRVRGTDPYRKVKR
ncbi:MAG: zf-HC2 domain-containing protein [Actinomycetota bacterium]